MKKFLLYFAVGLIIIMISFGHDLSQEVRSIYREESSNNSNNEPMLNNTEVENSTNEISESPEETNKEESHYEQESEQKVAVENRGWWSCSKCSGLVKMGNEPNREGCPQDDLHWHQWFYLGFVGDINYNCARCGAIIQVNDEPNREGCPQDDLHWHSWSKL